MARGWSGRVTRQLRFPADPAAQCAPAPKLGEGAAVRRCVGGSEPPQPLFLNFKWSEGTAGEGPRPVCQLYPRPPGDPLTSSHLASAWLPAYLGVLQHPARHVGFSPWLRRHRGILGSQWRRRPAARPGVPRRITPGLAQRTTTRRLGSSAKDRGCFGCWPASLRVCQPPRVCRLRPRSSSLPGAGPDPAAAQPYCTARAGPGLSAGAYQVGRREGRPRSVPDSATARLTRPPRPRPGAWASSLRTPVLRRPLRDDHRSRRTPAVELRPPAAARWYAPPRERTM